MSAVSRGQREVITVNVGGCGINLGAAQLQQFSAEAGIGILGDKEYETEYSSRIGTMFNQTSKEKYFARSLFVDTDASTIHNLKARNHYSSLMHPQYLIAGKEDCANNFAKGHYTTGKEMIDAINEQLRVLTESCDNLQGFLFNHAMTGGTGGGVGMLILERIAVDYRKRAKFGVHVFMDEENTSSPSLEVYNAMLAQHWMMDHTDVSVFYDNRALRAIYHNVLKQKDAKYANYNKLITKIVGGLTATTRFGISETLSTIHMDMVPFPRLHFLISSMYPLLPKSKPDVVYNDKIQALTKESYSAKHFSVDMRDFDVEQDKNMALSFSLRGPEINKYMTQTNEAMQFMNKNKCMSFMEWTATKPIVKYVAAQKAKQFAHDDVLITDKQVAMMANNSCITRLFTERMSKRYDLLYAQRSYVHHYVAEGMEEGEFAEAREDLGFLEKDYLDVLSEQQDDDNDDDDDEY